MAQTVNSPVDLNTLREEIQREYSAVATNPEQGFHFHTGRPLARMLGYDMDMVDSLPDSVVESFAGTGNPFSLGPIEAGQHVVDVGSGGGIDSLIAARLVGPDGAVIGVDMTEAMLKKARDGASNVGLTNVTFKRGVAEELPVEDGWADVVISNGVLNLCPDKAAALGEMHRVLRPGGRLQLADIKVDRPVSEEARRAIDLWTG